jgi:K+-sensing histidine kinase KdpD
VNWGRYAELYAFDAARGQVIREEQGIGATLATDVEPARRGTLVVYLGAAPGSGKTFTMLREGRVLRSQGEDVVIGFVETHGRPRTAEAIGGLEIVPPLAAPGGGAGPGDLDTAAVLARKPAVVLVDDLGRHAAGIAELRGAGIDVISTADVADVHAAADAVQAITGRAAAATVSDEMLADADELQFVDSSPEALRKRLGHGNIYPYEQVSDALATEFQTASLAALREIGLRLIADTLPAPASARPREPQDVLVAVSGPDRAEALVQHGVRLARRGGAHCSVLLLGPAQQRAAAASRIRRAALTAEAPEIEREGDAGTVIPQSVRETGARHLVLAAPPAGLLDRVRGSAIERLLVQLPDVHLHVLTDPAPAGQAGGAGHRSDAGRAGRPGEAAIGGGPTTRAEVADRDEMASRAEVAGRGGAANRDGADRQAGAANRDGAVNRDGAAAMAGADAGRRPPRAAMRVYLGHARGCGMTTAMLEEAVRRKSRGADVVVAAVEARGREGVSVLLEGLELIGDGTSMDTAAILARRPEVVCLDEISAATTTGESRLTAARRLADVGIAVVATAHLGGGLDEASLLALANEIELVDVAPPALIDRVRRGEIVPPAEIEHALATDYAPAELTERREHAFRIVAEHGDRRLAAYRQDDPRAGGGARPRILACVTPRPGMEQLIRRSAALAAQVDGEFLAATVADTHSGGEEAQVVVAYTALVAQLGGELAVLAGASPALVLAAYAQRHHTSEMVLARNDNNRPGRYPVLRELAGRAVGLELHVFPASPPG